jgi:hypothetical protein
MRGPTLITIRRMADALAKGQGQSTTTGHVLAAIASKLGPGAELLREWRLSPEVLSQAARIVTDDCADAVDLAMQRARELAGSSRVPNGVHLLAAVLEERTTAAHRAIDQCGASKLRTVAMQMATTRDRSSRHRAHDGLIAVGILRDLVD